MVEVDSAQSKQAQTEAKANTNGRNDISKFSIEYAAVFGLQRPENKDQLEKLRQYWEDLMHHPMMISIKDNRPKIHPVLAPQTEPSTNGTHSNGKK